MGCDGEIGEDVLHNVISTHTSRVGCDLDVVILQHIAQISTHTSRVGCDELKEREVAIQEISTHTSRVGCDCYI